MDKVLLVCVVISVLYSSVHCDVSKIESRRKYDNERKIWNSKKYFVQFSNRVPASKWKKPHKLCGKCVNRNSKCPMVSATYWWFYILEQILSHFFLWILELFDQAMNSGQIPEDKNFKVKLSNYSLTFDFIQQNQYFRRWRKKLVLINFKFVSLIFYLFSASCT